MKLKEYPILKLLCSLILGILIAKSAGDFYLNWLWGILLFITSILLASTDKRYFAYRHQHITGLLIYSLFIFWGILLHQFHFDSAKENYYGNQLSTTHHFLVKIIEPPQIKSKSVKAFVEVEAGHGNNPQQSLGKALVYFEQDSLAIQLAYGDRLIVSNSFKAIDPPLNPDQFDYKAYLKQRNILYQAYLKSNEWTKISSQSRFDIKHFALSARDKLLHILQSNHIKGDELSVAAGMLLGIRDMLSPELRQAYVGAGAMHILCVSGLHVGILFLILNTLLGFLQYRRYGKTTRLAIIVLTIWFYALLTGFSPSVVRAATMFSFISIGQNLKRHIHILSSLSASAFVLLLFNPTLIFNLGFQLSYAAVIAIVSLQKPIADIWTPNNYLVNKIWQLICVSIAAQIGTAPLSLYYFHQFPNFFILTNLIVIPAAYLVINLGILVLISSPIAQISVFLGKILNKVLYWLNTSISQIESWEYAVSHDIYLSPYLLVLVIILIMSTSYCLIQKKRKLIFANLLLIIIVLAYLPFNHDQRNEFVVYHCNKNTYIAIYSNEDAWIFCDSTVIKKPSLVNFQVENHELKKGVKNRHYILLDSVKTFTHDAFYASLPFIKTPSHTIKIGKHYEKTDSILNIQSDYLIYYQSSQLRLPLKNEAPQLVVCGNIPPWDLEKLEDSTIHHTRKQGALIIYF